jgi:hypothetical protein
LGRRVGLGFAPDDFEGALGNEYAFVFTEIGKRGFGLRAPTIGVALHQR